MSLVLTLNLKSISQVSLVAFIAANLTACFSVTDSSVEKKYVAQPLAYQQLLPRQQVNNPWFQQGVMSLQKKMQNPALRHSLSKARANCRWCRRRKFIKFRKISIFRIF